jgi:hypothetical protein
MSDLPRLVGTPSLQGRVSLVVGTTFLHVNSLQKVSLPCLDNFLLWACAQSFFSTIPSHVRYLLNIITFSNILLYIHEYWKKIGTTDPLRLKCCSVYNLCIYWYYLVEETKNPWIFHVPINGSILLCDGEYEVLCK